MAKTTKKIDGRSKEARARRAKTAASHKPRVGAAKTKSQPRAVEAALDSATSLRLLSLQGAPEGTPQWWFNTNNEWLQTVTSMTATTLYQTTWSYTGNLPNEAGETLVSGASYYLSTIGVDNKQPFFVVYRAGGMVLLSNWK